MPRFVPHVKRLSMAMLICLVIESPVFSADANDQTKAAPVQGGNVVVGQPASDSAGGKLGQIERDFWSKTRNSKSKDDLEAYLRAFPNGMFVKLVLSRIKSLEEEERANKKEIGPAQAPPIPGGNLSPEVRMLMAEINALREMVEGLKVSRAAPAAAKPLTGRALVIGNGDYLHLGKLPNPRNDAAAIAAKLRSFGLTVELLLDGDRDAMAGALANVGRDLVADDVGLLFYAGHAVQLDGENYLLPVNAKLQNATPGYIKLIGVPLGAAIENMPNKTRLVFLDACRDNPISRLIVSTRTTLPKGLAPAESISGTLIAFATKDGSTAEDGTDRHSPYTKALLQYLDDAVDIGLVLRRVRESVMDATRYRQQPWEYGSLVGDQLILATMFKRK